jgi:hypothetical protein
VKVLSLPCARRERHSLAPARRSGRRLPGRAAQRGRPGAAAPAQTRAPRNAIVQRPQGRSSLARPPPRGAKCARGGQQPRAPAQLLAPWQPAQRAPRRQAAPYPAAAYTPPAAAARARARTHLKPSPAARQPRAPGGARTGLRAAPPTWPRLTGPSRHPASARHRLYARRRVSPARASDARRPMPPPHGGKRSTPKRQTSFVDLTYRVLHEPCPSYKLKEGPAWPPGSNAPGARRRRMPRSETSSASSVQS